MHLHGVTKALYINLLCSIPCERTTSTVLGSLTTNSRYMSNVGCLTLGSKVGWVPLVYNF